MNNSVTARENEMRVLQAVGCVGWLNAAQVAKWVWGDENRHSARVSADKVLKRLAAAGQVLRRESLTGVFVYVLTGAGALRANEGVRVSLFKDGYDLSQLDVGRQAPAVEYLVGQHRQGKTVLGAASLRSALKAGVVAGEGLTGADGLVFDSETGELRAVLVVRNTHQELVKKAQRIKKAAGELELLGNAALLRIFHRAILSPYANRPGTQAPTEYVRRKLAAGV
ncbi:MAG: hypothetical protein I8H90_10805 [Burkholderiales bacterium]|nr:hypothetical protein [Burkholderiales bacterium]MBH2069382.1 hypothetical protein [Burkholderiales bacterium]